MSYGTYDELCRSRRGWMKSRNDATSHRPNHYKKWTSEDEDIVSDPSMTIEEKAEVLGRSIYAVGARMGMLGVRNEDRNREWTDEELAIASDPSISNRELSERLNRSTDSVISKRFLLKVQGHDDLLNNGGHTYSDEDDEFIVTHTVRESSEHLGVSTDAIESRRRKLRRMGRLKTVDTHFSEDDLKIVSNLSLSIGECAKILNRSPKSITDKRCEMRRRGLL